MKLLLNRSGFVFCTIVLLAILLCMASFFYRQQSEQVLLRKQQQSQSLAAALAKANNDWQQLQRYQMPFTQLQSMGVITNEHRLAWVESLSALAAERPQLQLNFSFAAQRLREGAASEGGQAIYASAMKLHYLAQTPRTMLEINQRLASLPGLAQVQSCQLQRLAAAIAVDCRYDWMTIAASKL